MAAVAVVGAVIATWIAVQRGGGELRPVWTSILAPVDGYSVARAPALSRDGKKLAFSARDKDGKQCLWVRALDEQSSRVIAGTEGGGEAFWSPDGDWLGFFKDGKLQKVSLAGGAPQILADARGARGGTWGRDGTIVYVPNLGLGLYRVSASGGPAVRIDALEDAVLTSPTFPSFLPDGERFVYSNFREGVSWISVRSTDGSAPTLVGKAYSRAAYADGYLLFGSGSSLYAQAFDVSRLALSGERIQISDHVGVADGGTYFDYSF
jgi:serine/threonine-protein kinase